MLVWFYNIVCWLGRLLDINRPHARHNQHTNVNRTTEGVGHSDDTLSPPIFNLVHFVQVPGPECMRPCRLPEASKWRVLSYQGNHFSDKTSLYWNGLQILDQNIMILHRFRKVLQWHVVFVLVSSWERGAQGAPKLPPECHWLWEVRYSWHHMTLQWRYNERDGVSNHRRLDRLLDRLFKRRSNNKIKGLRHWSVWGGIRRWPVDSPHKGPVTRKMFPFDDVIMDVQYTCIYVPGVLTVLCSTAMKWHWKHIESSWFQTLAQEFVAMTSAGVTSGDIIDIMTTLVFQWNL